MKREKTIKIVNLIVAVLVALFAVGYSFAWFVNERNAKLELSGSSLGQYFASGDGSSGSPYVINKPKHLYNLAWLQNTGKFVDSNSKQKKYYFEVTVGINMSDYWLPPIGNDSYPFISEFNGDGKTISNLKITTDKSLLSKTYSPMESDTSYAFSQAVGMFGMTSGSSGKNAKITNFILQDPVVNVAANGQTNAQSNTTASTSYSSSVDKYKYAGLAVGYINQYVDVSSIGVYTSGNTNASTTLDIDVEGYSTENGILGGLDKNATTSITGGGATAGASIGFGGSLNFKDMYLRMKYISDNWGATTVNVPSDIDDGSYPNKNYALPLVVENDIENSYYSGSTTETVSTDNIGYYTGNGAKIYSKATVNNIYSDDVTYDTTETTKIIDIKIWTKNSNTSGTNADKTISEVYGHDIDSSIKSAVIELLNYNYTGTETERRMYGIRMMPQISQNSAVTLSSITVAGDTYETDSYLPNSAVWFVPQYDGYVKIVLAVMSSGTGGFDIYSIERNKSTSTDGNPYNGTLKSVTHINTVYKTTAGTFAYNDDSSGTQVYGETWARELTENRLYYYEIPVEAGNEYALGLANSGGAYLIYLDIGQNAGTLGNSTVTTDNVSAVDFIYNGVSIATGSKTDSSGATIAAGNFIVSSGSAYALYTATQTSIYFTQINNILQMVYLRYAASDTEYTNDGYTMSISGTIINEKTYNDTSIQGNGIYATDTSKVKELAGQSSGGGSSSSGGSSTTTSTVSSIAITDSEGTVTTATTLESGGTVTLSSSVTTSDGSTYSDTVTWTSSNESVATVSGGTVTAVGAGEATITATAGGKSAAYTVTVNGIVLTPSTLSLTVGGTGTLTATTYGISGTVTYSSVDTSVATVSDDGTVTAVAAGSTTITATVDNTMYSVECSVTVSAASTTTYTVDGDTLTTSGVSGVITFTGSWESKNGAKWSGTINGTTSEYTTALRASGTSGRSISITVAANTTVYIAFGGNVAESNASATLKWEDDTSLSATVTNNGTTSTNGLLSRTFATAGTYMVNCSGAKACIFAIIIVSSS